jgi:hypothetical protein
MGIHYEAIGTRELRSYKYDVVRLYLDSFSIFHWHIHQPHVRQRKLIFTTLRLALCINPDVLRLGLRPSLRPKPMSFHHLAVLHTFLPHL